MRLTRVRTVLRRLLPSRRRDRGERRSHERVFFVSLAVLLGLGAVASVLGALAAPDAASFWQNLVGGIVLVAIMTFPVWFVQRWRALGRPATTPERVRAARRLNAALFALWLFGLATAGIGLAIDLTTAASAAASAAVGLLVAYIAGWGVLVFFVLLRFPPLGRWLRARRAGARAR